MLSLGKLLVNPLEVVKRTNTPLVFSHWQLTGRWWYGTPDPYPDGTVGDTSFAFRRRSCSVASLSSNAAQIASVKSPRAPTPSADDSHGVVPAAGTSAMDSKSIVNSRAGSVLPTTPFVRL